MEDQGKNKIAQLLANLSGMLGPINPAGIRMPNAQAPDAAAQVAAYEDALSFLEPATYAAGGASIKAGASAAGRGLKALPGWLKKVATSETGKAAGKLGGLAGLGAVGANSSNILAALSGSSPEQGFVDPDTRPYPLRTDVNPQTVVDAAPVDMLPTGEIEQMQLTDVMSEQQPMSAADRARQLLSQTSGQRAQPQAKERMGIRGGIETVLKALQAGADFEAGRYNPGADAERKQMMEARQLEMEARRRELALSPEQRFELDLAREQALGEQQLQQQIQLLRERQNIENGTQDPQSLVRELITRMPELFTPAYLESLLGTQVNPEALNSRMSSGGVDPLTATLLARLGGGEGGLNLSALNN